MHSTGVRADIDARQGIQIAKTRTVKDTPVVVVENGFLLGFGPISGVFAVADLDSCWMPGTCSGRIHVMVLCGVEGASTPTHALDVGFLFPTCIVSYSGEVVDQTRFVRTGA